MHIWVDADACPRPVKDILFRASERAAVPLTLVANQLLAVPPSPLIRAIQVAGGFDVADHYITEAVQAGDLVVSADIPLAARVIAKGAQVLEPRGELLTAAIIGERLAVRDFMEGLRNSGVQTGGPAAYGQAERQAFGRQLDRLLAAWARKQKGSRP